MPCLATRRLNIVYHERIRDLLEKYQFNISAVRQRAARQADCFQKDCLNDKFMKPLNRCSPLRCFQEGLLVLGMLSAEE